MDTLPYMMSVFHALKKHGFEKKNEIRAKTYKHKRKAGLKISFNCQVCIDSIILNPFPSVEQKDAIQKMASKHSVSGLIRNVSAV